MSPRSGNPHDLHNLENYCAVHDACMHGFSSFIVHDCPIIDIPDYRALTIGAPVYCQGGLVIHVQKTLDINDRHPV